MMRAVVGFRVLVFLMAPLSMAASGHEPAANSKVDVVQRKLASLGAVSGLDAEGRLHSVAAGTRLADRQLAAILPCAEQLRVLDLTASDVTADGLKLLGSFHRLEALYLGDAAVDDASLKSIGTLTILRTLDLAGTRITDAGVEHLAGCKQLENLYLSNTSVTNACCDSLLKLTHVKLLRIGQTRIDAVGIARLQEARQELAVLPALLSVRAVEEAARLSALEAARSLREMGAWLNDDGDRVRMVMLDDCEEPDEALALVSRLPTLETLHIRSSRLNATALDHLAGLGMLTRLRFYECTLDTEALAAVSRLPKLTELELSHCRLPDVNVRAVAKRHFSQATRLKKIVLSPRSAFIDDIDATRFYLKTTTVELRAERIPGDTE